VTLICTCPLGENFSETCGCDLCTRRREWRDRCALIDHEGRILAMLQAKDPTWTRERLRLPSKSLTKQQFQDLFVTQSVYSNSARSNCTDEEWAVKEAQRDAYLAGDENWQDATP
jgi:hypothetical protein